MPLGQRAPDRVEVDRVRRGDHTQQQVVVVGGAVGPRQQRSLAEGALRVDHHLGIDLEGEPQPGAGGARAVGGVEREGPRRQLGQRRAVLRAGEALGVGERPTVLAQDLDAHQAVGQAGRGLQAVGEPAPEVVAHHQAVDHHLDGVSELLVQRRDLVEQVGLAVHRHAREALGPHLLEHVAVLALAVPHQGGQNQEPRALGQRQHLVGDLLHALPGDGPAAHRAVGLADARVEQPQVVVDLGDGRHRRARVAAGGLLVDRDRGGQALDVIDVRLVHLAEELARVGRQALHVAPLPLGVERVEGEARLPAPGQARDHRQPVARDVHRDVDQVVLAGPHHADRGCGGGARLSHRSSVVRGSARPPWVARCAFGPRANRRAGRLAHGTCVPPGSRPTVRNGAITCSAASASPRLKRTRVLPIERPDETPGRDGRRGSPPPSLTRIPRPFVSTQHA